MVFQLNGMQQHEYRAYPTPPSPLRPTMHRFGVATAKGDDYHSSWRYHPCAIKRRLQSAISPFAFRCDRNDYWYHTRVSDSRYSTRFFMEDILSDVLYPGTYFSSWRPDQKQRYPVTVIRLRAIPYVLLLIMGVIPYVGGGGVYDKRKGVPGADDNVIPPRGRCLILVLLPTWKPPNVAI